MHRIWLISLLVLAAAPSRADVSYSGIDASTLRVFAVGTVGITDITGQGFTIQAAEPQAGHGTGFAVDPQLVITANHVIEGARHVVIRLPGQGGFLPARVVYANKDHDVAVLHVNATLTPIRMATDDKALHVRQTIYAVGYPLDPSRTQAQSAKGIIAGQLEDTSLQLDISLNPGNSGGPLVDEGDTVVGMVVARGDVAKGVQGIGKAVPIAQLRAALAEARKQIAHDKPAATTPHDMLSAQVVDELVRQGTLQAVRGADDLKRSFERRDLQQQIDQLGEKLDDADLLVFVAGTMWNASLAVRYGGVRKIGDTTLGEPEAQALANDLSTAAVRFIKRGRDIDPTVGARSSFVRIALGHDAGMTGAVIASYQPGFGIVAAPARSRWSVQGGAVLRRNETAMGGWGGEFEIQERIGGGIFFGWGISAGTITLDAAQGAQARHTFYALELGVGARVAGPISLYVGLAPSYYSASVDTTSRGELELQHARALASLDLGRVRVTSGLRVIGSTLWLEPIGLGINL